MTYSASGPTKTDPKTTLPQAKRFPQRAPSGDTWRFPSDEQANHQKEIRTMLEHFEDILDGYVPPVLK